MRRFRQDFIFGVRISKETEVDVKELCSRYGLDYACAGEFGGDSGVVIGLKIPMSEVVGEEDLGKGRVQKFSMEDFIMKFHETRESLNGVKMDKIKKELNSFDGELMTPNVWAVSYME